MEPVRVAVVTYDWYLFDPLVRRMCEAAADGGDAVDVVCLRQKNEKAFDTHSGVRIYRLPQDRGFGRPLMLTLLCWLWFMVLASWKLSLLHLRNRYDVVHVHNIPEFLVFTAWLPKLMGAKVILHVQDLTPELLSAKAQGKKRKVLHTLACWQEQISCRFADSVITVGWPFEQLLVKRGVPKQKITIILNSADPKIFRKDSRLPSPFACAEERGEAGTAPFTVMFHGTLVERHGLDVAVRALAEARKTEPRLRLELKGIGEQVPELMALAEELGVREQVVISEPSRIDEIPAFIAGRDAGIIPYRNNGFSELLLPTKAYEFAIMERPMITSDTPAIRSMFRDQSVLWCKPEDTGSLAEAMIRLCREPELRREMVENALADYNPYRWEDMALRYRQLLRTLSRKVELPIVTVTTERA